MNNKKKDDTAPEGAAAAASEREPLARRHTVGVGYGAYGATATLSRYPQPQEIPTTASTAGLRFRARGNSPESRRRDELAQEQKYEKRKKVAAKVWSASKWCYFMASLVLLVTLGFALRATNRVAMSMQDKWHRTYDAYSQQQNHLAHTTERLETTDKQREICKDQMRTLVELTQEREQVVFKTQEDLQRAQQEKEEKEAELKRLRSQMENVAIAFRHQNEELVEARKKLSAYMSETSTDEMSASDLLIEAAAATTAASVSGRNDPKNTLKLHHSHHQDLDSSKERSKGYLHSSHHPEMERVADVHDATTDGIHKVPHRHYPGAQTPRPHKTDYGRLQTSAWNGHLPDAARREGPEEEKTAKGLLNHGKKVNSAHTTVQSLDEDDEMHDIIAQAVEEMFVKHKQEHEDHRFRNDEKF